MGTSVILALVLGLVASAVANTGDADIEIEIEIDQGLLSGLKEDTVKGRHYYAFRSIPYAKPPIGSLRFKDPEPAEGWNGTRKAFSYPPKCIQNPVGLLVVDIHTVEGEEDCLYLNVYTPGVKVPFKYPVLVYIHGGAFFSGESTSYGAKVLLDHDIILVVLQYRIGILGFLSTEDSIIPGNFGLKDQTLALQWVRKNIGHFGGDPDNVTLFGESAGAASVMFQMLIPEAKGLFARGIMMSGSALHNWAVGKKHAKMARKIGLSVNCPVDEGSQVYLKCMQETSAILLTSTGMDLHSFLFLPAHMQPRVDGIYLRDHPRVLVASGQYHKVPVIAGVSAHEGALLTNYIYRSDERRKMCADDISIFCLSLLLDEEPLQTQEELVRKAFDYYVGGFIVDNVTADSITQMLGDNALAVPQDITVLLLSRHQPAYYYELRHRGQWSFGDYANTIFSRRWVQHGDDLIYLFESQRIKPIDREEDLGLRDIMTSLWANFAKTGIPTPDDSLGFIWDAAQESSFQHLVLQPKPFIEDDTRKEIRDFWFRFPTFQFLRKIFYREKNEL